MSRGDLDFYYLYDGDLEPFTEDQVEADAEEHHALGLPYFDDPNFDDTFPADPVSTDDPNYLG